MITRNLILKNKENKIETVFNDLNDNSIAFICHPHPLFGGSITNKVVTTLEKAFNENCVSTIKFNFRGVGRSTGKYGHGIIEIKDLKFVFDAFKNIRNFSKIYIAGFSFGGHVAAQFAYNYKLTDANLVLVAPAISNFSTKNIFNYGILIQGAQDELVNPDDVIKWNKKQNLNLHEISTSGHFFHNHLGVLKKILIDYLKND